MLAGQPSTALNALSLNLIDSAVHALSADVFLKN